MSDALRILNDDELPWYHKGVRFRCTGCGRCCTGNPGYVWVNEKEITAIARFLNMEVDHFAKRYLRQVGKRFSLKEDPNTYDCVFLQDKQCRIYTKRPTQCRSYPFWPQILSSKDAWERESSYCEGICDDAPPIHADDILKTLTDHCHNSPME